MQKLFLVIILIIGFVLSFQDLQQSLGGEPEHEITIRTEIPKTLFRILEKLDYDVLPPMHNDSITLFASNEELKQILNVFPRERLSISGKRAIPPGYRNLEAINKFLFDTNAKHPSFTKVVDIIKEYGPGKTWEGRPIYAIKISTSPNGVHDKPAVLILSAHHSREIVTPEIALTAIEQITTGYAQKIPMFTKFVEDYDIWIVPVLNVDGLEYVWTKNNMWRKNRRPESDGKVYGIDLNRNYDLDWVKCGGSTSKSSETYKGPYAMSEPETQAVWKMSQHLNFMKILDFHSYGREVLHGYHSCTKMDPVWRRFQVDEAKRLAKFGSYSVRDPSGNGQHQSWQMKNQTLYSFLVETHTTFQPTYSSAQEEIKRILPIIWEWLKTPVTIKGNVVDAATNAPVSAKITINGINWYADESRWSRGPFGAFHLWLPNGVYTLKFQADGYVAQTTTVSVALGQTRELKIRLQKA